MNNTTAFATLLLAILAAPCVRPEPAHAADAPDVNRTPPIVGAIRWDGWYGQGPVVQQTQRTLGPQKYHFRLPWFARVLSAGQVQINGDTPEIIAQELAYAAQAGLNYWAFVDYWSDVELTRALRRYQAATDKRGVRYCFVEEGGRLDSIGAGGWARLVDNFKDPNYQTVLAGRPLLFVFGKPRHLGKAQWEGLGAAAVAAGLKRPYLVLMGWQPEQDAKDMETLGFDAVSAYAGGGSYSMKPPSYGEQCAAIQRQRWDKCRALRIPCVTLASAGWDTRPRNERPPPWIKWVTPTPDSTPPEQQQPLIDAVTATPDELAAHLRAAVEWTQHNRDINPSNAIIIYAWNENDEGGWLIPTRDAAGRPNEERIQALHNVLRAAPALAPSPPTRTTTSAQ